MLPASSQASLRWYAEADAQVVISAVPGGDLTSLKVKGLELMGHSSGHHAGYWEQNPARSAQLTATVTIDPVPNKGERAEVSVKGLNVPGLNYDLEIRYTYAIFSHQAGYAKTQVSESRYGAKLNAAVFDWMSIDAQRNLLMPTGSDWDHGSPLNMKEARRLTTGIYKGRAEHKYDYSAIQSEIPAFGWSSTKERLGFFFINPSKEFLSGGPTKVELTGHLDDNQGGDPEFFKGDDYFHWCWYVEYPKLFPKDVHFTVGKSDFRKDWFFEQVPHVGENDGTGRGNGAATTWTIAFPLSAAVTGKGILRLAITGVAARRIDVAVNGKPAGTVDGLVYNATINRDGIQGHWVEKNVTFDASLMHAGDSELALTIPAGGSTSGIIYDYLRLELVP
jgi:hypothetical protein